MSRYKAYVEYKDSGVDWLGRAPSQWTICRIKNTATINPSKSEVRGIAPNAEVSFIPMEAIGENGELDASRTKPISEVISGYSYVADGDVMIAKITPCFENGKGAIAKNLLNGIGFATTEVINIRPNHPSDSAYFLYLLSTDPFRRLAEGAMYGAGGQKRVADSFVAEYHFSLPTVSERTKIAAFLDHETAKIDALIEKQQRLIELLKEKRQAVISHAVTKGLNSNAPMKDSGVEWLGEVPTHWVVARYKFCTTRVIVGIAEAATHAYAESGVPIIRSTNIQEEGLNQDGMLFIKKDFAEQNSSKYLYKNDVVTVRTGYPGTSAVVPDELDQSHCFTNLVATPRAGHHSQFLAEYLNSYIGKNYFELHAWGSAQKNISVPILQDFPIAFPGKEEEEEIVQYISLQKQEFARIIALAKSSIELMQERRTALISATVTGKIDVRDWQAAV